MKFTEALALCEQGERICRAGWNGREQFVYWQEGSVVPISSLRCDAIRAWARIRGLVDIKIMGHFDIKTAAGVVQCGWLATQGDMQAEDWEVYGRGLDAHEEKEEEDE
jgi:hypothetical protein